MSSSVNSGLDFAFKHTNNIERAQFNWMAVQREAAAVLIPPILRRLRDTAPVSSIHPDGGRFKKSIGFRVETAANVLRVKFVSTAPYAPYVIYPTKGGQTLTPQNTLAMRFQSSGVGQYVFAKSVLRGETKGNDFYKKVAHDATPAIERAFEDAVISLFYA